MLYVILLLETEHLKHHTRNISLPKSFVFLRTVKPQEVCRGNILKNRSHDIHFCRMTTNFILPINSNPKMFLVDDNVQKRKE